MMSLKLGETFYGFKRPAVLGPPDPKLPPFFCFKSLSTGFTIPFLKLKFGTKRLLYIAHK